MTTIKQFKEFLNTLDDEATIKIISANSKCAFFKHASFIDLDLSEDSDNCEYIDIRKEKTLLLGW